MNQAQFLYTGCNDLPQFKLVLDRLFSTQKLRSGVSSRGCILSREKSSKVSLITHVWGGQLNINININNNNNNNDNDNNDDNISLLQRSHPLRARNALQEFRVNYECMLNFST